MRAVVATRPGPPEVLEPVERPDPRPGPGQVLVDVTVAATTFVDTQIRAGRGPLAVAPDDFPFVPGNGVAGSVAAVGAGVDPSWLHRRVVTTTGGRGGYASAAVAVAGDLHAVPAGIDDRTAAALLADGRTALALTRAAAIKPGEVVVVTAAGGGLGSLLVQLASAAGGRVVALAGAPRKLELARSLGAAVAVDYRQEWWPSAVADAAAGVDVVFDGVGGAVSPALVGLLAPGGLYVEHGIASGSAGDVHPDELAARGAAMIGLGAITRDAAELHRLVDDALAMAAAGDLRPTIGQTFPLDRAADAHAAMEARTVLGKTLLLP